MAIFCEISPVQIIFIIFYYLVQNIKKRQTLEVFKERLRLKSEILLLIKKQTRLYAKQVGQEHLPYHKEATGTAQNLGTNARTAHGTNGQRDKRTDKVTDIGGCPT